MKKLKIIMVLQYLVVVIPITVVLIYLLGWLSFDGISPILSISVCIVLMFCAFIFLDVLKDEIFAKFGFAPSNVVKDIFNYLSNKHHGDKHEFVRKYGEDVYLNCLNKGIIHETYGEDGGTYWEYTICGERLKKEFNS